MMMQLMYPGTVVAFYAALFEFLTFDIIPTDGVYDEVFGFENDEPYSESAANIGYESRLLIINSGSMTIFVLYILLKQLIFGLVQLMTPNGSKLHNYVVSKRGAFFYGGFADFVNEMYLSMAYSVMINTTAMSTETWALTVNSIYAGNVAAVLVLFPIRLACDASNLWKKKAPKAPVTAPQQQLEGGESESRLQI